MFRELSEDEARHVIRWQAPELSGRLPVANTRQVAKPVSLGMDKSANTSSSKEVSHDKNFSPANNRDFKVPSEVANGEQNSRDKKSINAMHNPSADMLQTSYDEGYELGFKEGNAAIQEKSVRQLRQIIASLSKAPLSTPDAVLEQEVLGLSLDIARLLLRREIAVDPTALSALVSAGVEQLPQAREKQLRVFLHPQDAALLRTLAEEATGDIEFVDDITMRQGDCSIESGASTVHGGIDDWLEIIGEKLGILPAQASGI